MVWIKGYWYRNGGKSTGAPFNFVGGTVFWGRSILASGASIDR